MSDLQQLDEALSFLNNDNYEALYEFKIPSFLQKFKNIKFDKQDKNAKQHMLTKKVPFFNNRNKPKNNVNEPKVQEIVCDGVKNSAPYFTCSLYSIYDPEDQDMVRGEVKVMQFVIYPEEYTRTKERVSTLDKIYVDNFKTLMNSFNSDKIKKLINDSQSYAKCFYAEYVHSTQYDSDFIVVYIMPNLV